MNAYLVEQKFYYSGELQKTSFDIILSEYPVAEELSGEDFESLWNFCYEYPMATYFDMWEFKPGKRFIQHCNAIIRRVTPKNCKPWRYVVSSRETTISMKDLMKFDSEKVIKYLKERGMTSCPIMK